MTTHSKTPWTIFATGIALAAATLVGAAQAQVATGTTGIDASGQYQQEVNACNTGRTQQDRATCLEEARNAQGERKRGTVSTTTGPGASTTLDANATARCQVFSGEDRVACEARVLGAGTTQGSVAGGGVLREVETGVPPKVAPAH